jgi:hypothetical protein
MERRLRIRIERIFPIDDTVIEEILIPNDYIVEYAKNNGFTFGSNISNLIYGMSAKVIISKFSLIENLDIVKDDINFLNDYSDIIANVEIEINTRYQDEVWIYPNFKTSILTKHFILNAVQSRYKTYGNIIEVIKFIDHKDKSVIRNLKPKISKVGTPYRLYINNQLMTEKFYPYNVYEDQQLEEVLFVNLPAGTHNIKLVTLFGDNLKINGFACDDLIMTNISVDELSFQIQ